MSANTQAGKTATTLSSIDSDASTEQLASAVIDLAEQVNELTDRVADLEQENQQLRDEMARADADIKSRVHDLEQTADTDTAVADSGSDTEQPSVGPETETALEDLVTVPDTVIEQESANTQRAVFVANDIESYTTSVPAGRSISSGELRRVLQAGTDASGHQQTVARVMQLLDDLGGDETEIVERRGTRRLILTDSIVSRISRLTSSRRCDDRAPVGV
jgi:hypothetical protein